ncbi:MAG: Rrf2 family transcriptional regulator [bacterium]|nr:Rrf2 family transcriptional regulator [bacterium]MBK8166615.1 Rrf2 family transcriptional regulator [bacterium]
MISQTTEYALRAVVWLALTPDSQQGTKKISEAIQVPSGYLSKVLQKLTRAGLVTSSPGRSGGFRLARDPADIRVLEVVNAVDPLQRIQSCPLGLASHGSNLCALHRKLDDDLARTEEAFASTTITDLLDDRSGTQPLCES